MVESSHITKINFNNYNEQLANVLCDTTDICSYSQLTNLLLQCRNANLKTRILNLLNQRKKYYTLLKKSPTNEYLISKYGQVCQTIKTLKYELRSKYYSMKINNSLGKPKLIWREINNAIYNKTNKPNTVNAIKLSNSQISTNIKAISNEFNTYFKDIGKTLHDRIVANHPIVTPNLLPSLNPNSIFLAPTTIEEISSNIKSLKKSNCTKDIISANALNITLILSLQSLVSL